MKRNHSLKLCGFIRLLVAQFGFITFSGWAAPGFVGAPSSATPLKPSPLTAEDELTTFTLPPGFSIELVAADPDFAKAVTVVFDDAGKMWTVTAVEYPVDENENPERAHAL